MLGDYISTSFASGTPVAVLALASRPAAGRLDEAIYAAAPALTDSYSSRTACVKARPRVGDMRFLAIAASFFTIAVLVAPHP